MNCCDGDAQLAIGELCTALVGTVAQTHERPRVASRVEERRLRTTRPMQNFAAPPMKVAARRRGTGERTPSSRRVGHPCASRKDQLVVSFAPRRQKTACGDVNLANSPAGGWRLRWRT